MDVPDENAAIWRRLVTGEQVCVLRFLAARILLGRLVRCVNEDNTLENVRQCAAQIHSIYANNSNTPSVQEDLRTLSREEPRHAGHAVTA